MAGTIVQVCQASFNALNSGAGTGPRRGKRERMKRVYVNEQWCLGCHLCEYYCAFANSGKADMVKALKGVVPSPNIRIEDGPGGIHFAVACRHCKQPLCAKGCISGALTVQNGVVTIDEAKCVGCYTCVASCPYGAVLPGPHGAVQKCQLCTQNAQPGATPACVAHCPNNAIVFEERGPRRCM